MTTVSVCSVPSVMLPRLGEVGRLGEFRDVGVVAVEVGGPEVLAPADDLLERVAAGDRGDAVEHAAFAEDHALDRGVEGDGAAGDVGDGEGLRQGRPGERGGKGEGRQRHQVGNFHFDLAERVLRRRDR